MSEYQFYEFKAIDKPLSKEDFLAEVLETNATILLRKRTIV